ncbi:hypothetical protein KY359_03765, partial [Candidatus Woesearchaeota archaeon]|nr:hypothetical protein [Candidatus Woesearchaeota archaeon]
MIRQAILKQKRAEILSLVIVLAVIAVMGIGAFVLSKGAGSEISGFNVYLDDSYCGVILNDSDETYYIDSDMNCAGFGFGINASRIVIECRNGASIRGDGSDLSIGIFIPNYLVTGTMYLGNTDNVTIKNCNIQNFDTGIYVVVQSRSASDRTITNLNFSGNTVEDVNYGIMLEASVGDTGDATLSNVYLTGNTIDAAEIDFNATQFTDGSGGTPLLQNVYVSLNNFLGAGLVGTGGSGYHFCRSHEDTVIRSSFGNYYADTVPAGNKPGAKGTTDCSPPYLATLPSPYTGTLPVLCGATVIGALELDAPLANQTTDVGATCPSTGLTLGAASASLDCNQNSITGLNAGVGINLTANTGLVVRECSISNFTTGIWGAPTGVNVTENVLHNTEDLKFSGGSYADVYLNHFYGGGVTSPTVGDYCSVSGGYRGNFYKWTLGPSLRGSNDCGNVTMYNETGGTLFEERYNVSSFYINWTPQDAASFMPITYFILSSDDGGSTWNDFSEPGVPPTTTDNYTEIDARTVLAAETYDFLVFPFDSRENGTNDTTGSFDIVNDRDGDNASVLLPSILEDVDFGDGLLGIEHWDCNDNNASIHRPSYRENDTNPDLADFCYNAEDDDCDVNYTLGGQDWLDDGCGHGFTTATFDSTLYTNGTIVNLSTSELLAEPGSHYVLVNNTFGMVEYTSETNLTGVNLGSVFT